MEKFTNLIEAANIDRNELEVILEELVKLKDALRRAHMTKDRRSRDKKIRDARKAISDYAYQLPKELKCYLYEKVDVNAMSYQYAESDISRCISAIEELIKKMPEDS